MSSNKEYDYVYRPIIPKTVKEAEANLARHESEHYMPHLGPREDRALHARRKYYIEQKERLMTDLEIARRNESREGYWVDATI